MESHQKKAVEMEKISSTVVPIRIGASPDIEFNQNKVLEDAAEKIKVRHEILPPTNSNEYHEGKMALKANVNQLKKPVIYEPMGLEHDYDKLLSVDENPVVNSQNEQNLVQDQKYYSDYYAGYFQKYYSKLKSLYNPIQGDNANQASANVQDIFKYFPIMYNQNYNDNLLSQSSTLYKLDDLSQDKNPYLTPCECQKGKVPCDCPLRARTIVMPIIQPVIQQVPAPGFPKKDDDEEDCEEECGADCVCECEKSFFFRFKSNACINAPAPPQEDDDSECEVERYLNKEEEPQKQANDDKTPTGKVPDVNEEEKPLCKCKKTCDKKCGVNCPKYMRNMDGKKEGGKPLEQVKLDNHNVENSVTNINTIDRVTKETVSNNKIVKNIQNFYEARFVQDEVQVKQQEEIDAKKQSLRMKAIELENKEKDIENKAHQLQNEAKIVMQKQEENEKIILQKEEQALNQKEAELNQEELQIEKDKKLIDQKLIQTEKEKQVIESAPSIQNPIEKTIDSIDSLLQDKSQQNVNEVKIAEQSQESSQDNDIEQKAEKIKQESPNDPQELNKIIEEKKFEIEVLEQKQYEMNENNQEIENQQQQDSQNQTLQNQEEFENQQLESQNQEVQQENEQSNILENQ